MHSGAPDVHSAFMHTSGCGPYRQGAGLKRRALCVSARANRRQKTGVKVQARPRDSSRQVGSRGSREGSYQFRVDRQSRGSG